MYMSKSDQYRIHFEYDNEEIRRLREKQYAQLTNKKLPKFRKIKADLIHIDYQNLNTVEEKPVIDQLPENLKSIIFDDQNSIIIIDGQMVYQNVDEVFQSVKFTTYHQALKENNQEALSFFYEKLNKEEEDQFIALNHALFNSALLIDIPKNVVIKEMIKIYILGEQRDLIHHTLIRAEESSQVSILETYANLQSVNANILNDIEVMNNATINYIGVDRFNAQSRAYINRCANVHRDGKITYALGQLNSGNSITYNKVYLMGPNAEAESRNLLLTSDENVHAVHVNIEHLAPHTVGTITNHGIVLDSGFLHIDGIGKIHQGMNQSNAQQSTKIIMLSDDAKVSANPYLLIDEYDVMAGHGAGVGKVDEEQLYYLMSRGLSKKDAEKLIILGFLYPVIELIDSENIRENIVQMIDQKLS